MKILHLTTHLNKGGITSYVFSLALQLKEKSHIVCVASSGGELTDVFKKNGIGHIDIPIRTKNEFGLKQMLSYFALKKYLQNNKFDVIHAHTRVTQVLGATLSKKFNIPLVTTCHGFFRPRFHRKRFPCWGDRVIAISKGVKGHLINDFNVREKSIRLVYSGINIDNYKEYSEEQIDKIRNEHNISKDNFVVGTIARFSDVKGLDYLLKAAEIILKENDNFVFLLIGTGKEEDSLKKTSQELNIQHRVRFINSIVDSKIYFSIMDVFVMPSLQEGLGLAILEAQLHRIPVVASNVGGIPEIVRHNSTGILVEPKDRSSLAKAILQVKNDNSLRGLVVENAYQMVRKDFSLKLMADNIEKVYLELTC